MAPSASIPILDPVGFHYHHGRGEHVLVRGDADPNRPPMYSISCCLHYCCDCMVLLLIVGFLVFAFWLCYYLYNNYD
jgi:hypothetical protein